MEARCASMLKAFELMGVKRDMVFAKLGVKGIEDIKLDQLVSLRGIYNAIRENELTPERAFSTEDPKLADKSKQKLEQIKEKYTAPGKKAKKETAEPAPKPAENVASAPEPPAPENSQREDGNNPNVTPSAEAGPEVSDSTASHATGTAAAATDAEPGPQPETEQQGIPLDFGDAK
jgi:hypothetical protein